eukprot:1406493-Pyramimonas_sp.AAC.1
MRRSGRRPRSQSSNHAERGLQCFHSSPNRCHNPQWCCRGDPKGDRCGPSTFALPADGHSKGPGSDNGWH